jgi:hypothetical protein
MKYFFVLFCFQLLIFSCKKPSNEKINLQQEIDLIFKKYSKENYIDKSVLEYYKNLKIDCSKVNSILDRVYKDDQEVRHSGEGNMYVIDSVNLIKVVSIFRNCNGNFFKNNLKIKSYLTLFLILQHSDDKDLMAYYYNDFKGFVNNGKLDKFAFALYIDRFLLLNNKKQFFGSQIVKGRLYKLENPNLVNVWRNKMNLKSIEVYLERYGLDFEKEIKESIKE